MIKIKDALDAYNAEYDTDFKTIEELGLSLAREALKTVYAEVEARKIRDLHKNDEIEVEAPPLV